MVLPHPRKAAAIGAKMLPKQQNAKTALCAEHFLGCLVSYGDRGRLFAPVQTLFSEHCFCGTKHRMWSELPWAHPPLYSPTRRVPVVRYLLFASPPLPRALYQFKRNPRDLLLLGICLIFVTPGNLGIFSCKHLQVLLCWRSQTCVSAARRDVRRCLLSACRVRTPAALQFSKLVPNLQVHQSRDTMSCLQSLLAEGCYFGLNAT